MISYRSISILIILLPYSFGCSGGSASDGPTDEEINSAVGAVYDAAIAQALEMGEERALELAPELHATKKIACSKAENNNGFNCDVEIDSTMPMLGRQSKVGPMRFVKSDSGWVAIQEQQ